MVSGEGAVVLAGVAGKRVGGVDLFVAVDALGGRLGDVVVAGEEAGGTAALAARVRDTSSRVRGVNAACGGQGPAACRALMVRRDGR